MTGVWQAPQENAWCADTDKIFFSHLGNNNNKKMQVKKTLNSLLKNCYHQGPCAFSHMYFTCSSRMRCDCTSCCECKMIKSNKKESRVGKIKKKRENKGLINRCQWRGKKSEQKIKDEFDNKQKTTTKLSKEYFFARYLSYLSISVLPAVCAISHFTPQKWRILNSTVFSSLLQTDTLSWSRLQC